MLKLSNNPGWIKAKAEKEASGFVSVGGFYCEIKRQQEVKSISIKGETKKLETKRQKRDWRTKPRLSVYKSLSHIYAQLIDMTKSGPLIRSNGSARVSRVGHRELVEAAKKMGASIAERAVGMNYKTITDHEAAVLKKIADSNAVLISELLEENARSANKVRTPRRRRGSYL